MSGPEVRIVESLDSVDAADWDALHDGRNPFVAHAFLSGLERTGCLRSGWGWTPQHLTLWRGETLVAAAPGYLKTNSHGEFVFDHAWAHAYARHGHDYFPKWLCAVPYSPVTGPRLLAGDDASRRMLIAALEAMTVAGGFSSAHVNFHTEDNEAAFIGHARATEHGIADHASAWLLRNDIQYHWRNQGGWRDFDDFLAAMDHKHRKNIRQERAKVERSGVGFRVVHGDEANEDDLSTMHGFYLQTFAEYGNSPALTLEFLRHLARAMPRNLVMFLADHVVRQAHHERKEVVAGALCLRGGDTLYGRYWGASRQLPGLHFETCYYQGIDYCLREGLRVFEPGAQGEHKLARGFLPTLVRSRHWIADPAFAAALRPWCEEETASVRGHARLLAQRSPFRAATEPSS